MKSCRHWIELDQDGGIFEYCRGAKRHCTCSAAESQCNYLAYFSQPQKVCKRLRAKDRIEATVAAEARI